MKAHTTLRLEAGAVLMGSSNQDDYPVMHARWEGRESDCRRALISAGQAEDIAITGAGIIEGNPAMGPLRNPRGPAVIEMTECGYIRIEGLTLKSRQMWTLHPTYCHDVRIAGVTFDTIGPNSDGIDPDSCQRVIIDGCTFTTGDDNIAIKSGKGQEGVRVGRPCEDILITNCTFIKDYTSVALGSELSGGIRRVRISHCTFKQGLAGRQLKSRAGRAGYVEDITAEHLVIGPEPLLEIDNNYRYNADPQGVLGSNGLTLFKNIRISDVAIASKYLTIEMDVSQNHVTGVSHDRTLLASASHPAYLQSLDWFFRCTIDVHIAGPPYFTNNVDGIGLAGSARLKEEPTQTKDSH
jgi:hypothetical protein